MKLILSLLFSIFCFVSIANALSQGAIRFARNGDVDTTRSWSAGIVQIYFGGSWRNICDDLSFDQDEADVICHQLGYEGADSFTNTGLTTQYGMDNTTGVISELNCEASDLTVSQCSFFNSGQTSSCDDSNDAIVRCGYPIEPTNGDIRLTGGSYSNEGLLEIYCNDEWGTVCSEAFDYTEAHVACNQLGYNDDTDYNHLSLQGTASQKIWLKFRTDIDYSLCYTFDNCLTNCQSCPSASSEVTSCTHSQDVTLECEYDSSYDKATTGIDDTCDSNLAAGLVAAVLVGIIVASLCCCFIVILLATVPFCICCCLGVGVGAAVGGSRKPKAAYVS